MSASNVSSIPHVDLSPFAPGGKSEKRAKASQDLYNACHNLGFAYITGHGVPPALLEDSFRWSKKLFDLPRDEKMKAPHPESAMPHRGYSAPGIEKVYSKDERDRDEAKGEQGTSLRKIEDLKESYEVGSEENSAQPNIWLPEETLPGFRAFALNFYWELDKLAKRILEAISLSLKLTKQGHDKLMALHSGHNNQLRLLHYPSVEATKLRQQVIGRMPAHQDWSTFTFLFQDAVSGLELQEPEKPGSFIAAKPIPGTCILNVGDMLQRFSNGIFPSAMHRVTLPYSQSPGRAKSSDSTPARYSIPYFVAPDHEAIVHCLPSCVTAERAARYEPVKWAEYGDYMSKYMYKKKEAPAAKQKGRPDAGEAGPSGVGRSGSPVGEGGHPKARGRDHPDVGGRGPSPHKDRIAHSPVKSSRRSFDDRSSEPSDVVRRGSPDARGAGLSGVGRSRSPRRGKRSS